MAEPNTEWAEAEGSATVESINLDTCRACSSAYLYSVPQGGAVTIIIGIPSEDLEYKAISHVWGDYNLVDMYCKRCSTNTQIRLRSTATFRNIMALAGSGSRIWMDNMSINQNDPSDLAAQLAVMGDIYSKAACVSVLLPPSDTKAYETIAEVVAMANTLLERKGQFDYNPSDENWRPGPGEEIKATGDLARRFFESMKSFQNELSESKYEYWMRAWTFQEWATSFDVEISLDIQDDSGIAPPTLQKVKSTIVYAAITIADYKLRKGQYALMNLGFSRGFCRPYLDNIKRLFPFEEAFLSFEEISESEIRYQTAFPNNGTDAILGLRSQAKEPRTGEEKFKARLNLMLDSFGSGPRRNATHKADLVLCWASMCNISYDYSKDDPLKVALTKIIRALRGRGSTVYNFISNEVSDQDVDLQFFHYAYAHSQCNATNDGLFAGLPIFTGRADTTIHFGCSVFSDVHVRMEDESPDPNPRPIVSSTRINGAYIKFLIPLDNTVAALNMLNFATSGKYENMLFTNVLIQLAGLLEGVPLLFLKTRVLVIVAIPLKDDPQAGVFYSWAVCSAAAMVDLDSIHVAREQLNGTLVLAKPTSENTLLEKSEGTVPTNILAYLTITDQECGTFLLPVSPQGELNLDFKTPQRPDIINSNLSRDRKLSALLKLEDSSAAVEELPISVHQEMPLIIGCELSWEVFKRKLELGKIELTSNNTAVQQIGEDRSLLRDTLMELCKRLKIDETDGSLFERDGRGHLKSLLEIDIGHLELIDQQTEVANKKRFNRAQRSASFSGRGSST